MERKEIASRLTARNGAASSPGMHLAGSKLSEAASYLKSARICLLTWVRDNYVSAENVDHHTDDVREILSIAQDLEDTRARLDVKASIFGK